MAMGRGGWGGVHVRRWTPSFWQLDRCSEVCIAEVVEHAWAAVFLVHWNFSRSDAVLINARYHPYTTRQSSPGSPSAQVGVFFHARTCPERR